MRLKKDITFIYSDSAEKAMFTPILEEAEKRGFSAKLTDNPFEKCEIGFYCQHTNFPQYSKFSFILLHDIIQGYDRWPDLWYNEPWDKYDIGILPSNQWENNWNQSSHNFYANPKKGVYKVGWPKADVMNSLKENSYKEEFYNTYGLDLNKPTVLYAPAWENDGKQDEFVNFLKPLDCNLIIKQAPFNEEKFPEIVKNIREMAELHKGIVGVTVLPPETNIFKAIAVSDILVSEESSTMAEAVMMGVPAVSVSDWLIPDVTPSRFPQCNYSFVTMTKKANLQKTIKEILENYDHYKKQTESLCEENFSNIGKSATILMDIVEDIVSNTPVRHPVLTKAKKKPLSFRKYLKHKITHFSREVYANYRVRYPLVAFLWEFLKKFKKLLKK